MKVAVLCQQSKSTCKQLGGTFLFFGSAAERVEMATVHRNSSARCDAAERDRSISGWLRSSGQVMEVGSRCS